MKIKKLLFYLLAALLGGCVPLSLHPLYTGKELIFEEKLLGAWSDGSTKCKFTEASGKKSYKLTVTDDDGKGKFDAHLVKIDDMLFLDLFPAEPELEANDFYKLHILPAHTFMKIEQIEPTLQMAVMNHDKMKDMLENDAALIKHEIVEGRVVLTASTKQLQGLMREHANDEGLFDEQTDLKRIGPKDPNYPNSIDPNEGSKK